MDTEHARYQAFEKQMTCPLIVQLPRNGSAGYERRSGIRNLVSPF